MTATSPPLCGPYCTGRTCLMLSCTKRREKAAWAVEAIPVTAALVALAAEAGLHAAMRVVGRFPARRAADPVEPRATQAHAS